MAHLKRRCGLALTESFLSMRGKKESGSVNHRDTMRYLVLAEKYGFDKLKKICIEEAASKADVIARREIVEDKHISNDAKLTIMDKMCDVRNNETERRLKQIEHTMELRCKEIERRRKEYAQVTEQWKAELRKEVDDLEERIKYDHEQFADKFKQKKLGKGISEKMDRVREELVYDIEMMSEELRTSVEKLREQKEDVVGRLQLVYDKMLDKLDDADKATKLEFKRELRAIKDSVCESESHVSLLCSTIPSSITHCCTKIEKYTDKVDGSLWGRLLHCEHTEETSWPASSCTLQGEVDKLTEEIAVKVQSITEVEVQNECAKLEQERTKAELHKYRKRYCALNTWIKWASPLNEEDETKCLCYRHATPRK